MAAAQVAALIAGCQVLALRSTNSAFSVIIGILFGIPGLLAIPVCCLGLFVLAVDGSDGRMLENFVMPVALVATWLFIGVAMILRAFNLVADEMALEERDRRNLREAGTLP